MANPNKQQGTRRETRTVNDLKRRGLKAWRLAEQGTQDPGDIALVDRDGDHWILETKHRDRLNIHDAVRKAKRKAEAADLPYPVYMTAVVWQRTDRSGGRGRACGTVVALDYDDWLELVSGRGK